MFKRVVRVFGGLAALLLAAAGLFVGGSVWAYDRSMARVYDLPLAAADSSEAPTPERLARGRHLGTSLGGCTVCHGDDLATPMEIDMGPLGRVISPNITMGGRMAAYTSAEFRRLIVEGVKRDGRGVTMVMSGGFRWWPDEDVAAVEAWVRSMPPVTREHPPSAIGVLGKVADRLDVVELDVARRVAGTPRTVAGAPAADATYGAHLVWMCEGCHGEQLSGGISVGGPGTPASANLTPHPEGLGRYDLADFTRALRQGVKVDGAPLDPIMDVKAMRAMSDTEVEALFAYLRTVPPRATGQ